MNISDLIIYLVNFLTKHGDVPFYLNDKTGQCHELNTKHFGWLTDGEGGKTKALILDECEEEITGSTEESLNKWFDNPRGKR